MNGQAAEATFAEIGKNVGLAGSGSAIFFGGLGISEIAAIVGILVGVAGLIVQVVYKRRADKREQLFHEARMMGFKLPGDPE